jgi:hypothetical protein
MDSQVLSSKPGWLYGSSGAGPGSPRVKRQSALIDIRSRGDEPGSAA